MANTTRSRSTGSSRATTKKTASKSSSRSNTTRKTSSSRSSSRSSAPSKAEAPATDLFSRFAASKAATPLIFIAAVLVIVGIDLLVSWNKFGLFFKILGVEILIAVIIWGICSLVFSGKGSRNSNNEHIDEV